MRQADSISHVDALPGQTSPHRFRPDIEGLRAIAVLAVVLFHAEVPGLGGGFVGVDVFFVISGFLITGLLWREVSTTETVRLRTFYGARARRLLPASALVGVVTAIGAALLLPPLRVQPALLDGVASALYVSNYALILQQTDYFREAEAASPFQHYWSLGVEEQFYLVWAPLILVTAWLIRRVRCRRGHQGPASPRPYLVVVALLAAASFTLSLAITFVMPSIAFFSLPTRAWQLAIGGMIALTATHWQRLPQRSATITGFTGLAIIALACTQLNETTLYPGIAALLPTIGTALIIGAGCATPTHGTGHLLALPPMRAIGRISYSWYLWHWPVLIYAPLLVGHPLNLTGRLTAAALSAVLAILTLRFVENPLRFTPAIRTSPWRSLGLGALSTTTAVAVAAALAMAIPPPIGPGRPAPAITLTATPVPPGSNTDAYDAAVHQTFSQIQQALTTSANIKAVPSNLNPPLAATAAEFNKLLLGGCMRMPFQGGQPACTTGENSATKTVALVGDSHAAMWNPAFEQIADQGHWRLETLTKTACPLMDNPRATDPLRRLAQLSDQCEQWRTHILARLRAQPPDLVVVSMWRGYGHGGGGFQGQTGLTGYDAQWLASLTSLIRQLRDMGSQVLVLGPVPDPGLVVPLCLSEHLVDASNCTPDRSTAVDETGIAAEAAVTEATGGTYADITELFCTADRCPVIVGDALVYLDWTHITIEYSRLLAPAMEALSDRALARS